MTSPALLGSVWVLLAALSPLTVLRFVHFASDQIGSANVSGAAGAMGNARQGEANRAGSRADPTSRKKSGYGYPQSAINNTKCLTSQAVTAGTNLKCTVDDINGETKQSP